MNTTLIENKKDYYEDYYPSPRVEKAIFNYLDQDYYTSEDNVFFTIYKKENDWFVNKTDIEHEIKNMFGLTLPDRIKIGPGEDDYIEPARNPVPKRVIQNWVNNHQGLKAHKEAMVHDKKKNSLKRRKDKGIEEDLENWGFDGEEIGPLKEHINNKLTNKFLTDFWPQYRNQVYSGLYNTYHPSAYVESFNRPDSNFEDVLEVVGDAVNEGKKLGLLDSSVGWLDMYDYDDDSITKLGDTGEMPPNKVTDDNGLPTLRDQLEILDNTNLDWIHGILLFDVLEDIVDEFKSYCGENGVDESGMGKCMDEFPPSPDHEQINRTGGTLKQDYYTLYNFMKELERTGVNVKDYMKSPIFPNIIKLVDDGTTDYDTSGEYFPMRQDSEAIDTVERMEELEEDVELSPEDKKNQIDRLETELDIDREDLKTIEKELEKINSPEYKGTSIKTDKDDKKKTVIGIGKDASAFQKGKYFTGGNPQNQGDLALNMVYEQEQETTTPAKPSDWKPDFNMSDETKELEKGIKKNSIEIKKQNIADKEKRLYKLKQSPDKASDSTGEMGDSDSTDPMSNTSTDSTKAIKITGIVDGTVTEHDDTEDGAERLYKQHAYDNEDYVDNSPFTRKETSILKALHKNLTKDELRNVSEMTPNSWSDTDKKFWNVMKLFGIEETHTEQNTRESRYAKWAYDNWTEDGDYGNIENPIKAPLKWYDIDRNETGSQIEYKSGQAEVLGFSDEDAGERADDDFYAWGGEMETQDYGDYEQYDSEITNSSFMRLDEQLQPEGSYHLNPDKDSPILNVPPIKIAQKFSDVNGYGQIKFDMQGGNGIAYFTDKNLVIKLTADESEYFTASKLVGTDNEYIVKVIESAKIKTSHSTHPIFTIVEEALPMTEEMEKVWSECCCGVDSPIDIDYLEEPVLVLPPVSSHDKCLPIYDNIIGIQKNFIEYGIVWSDIGIDNMGIKNGKLAVVDLGKTRGQGSVEGKIITLEHIDIRPLTSKQIKKQLVLI